jgi:hypothetical protein
VLETGKNRVLAGDTKYRYPQAEIRKTKEVSIREGLTRADQIVKY